MIFIKIKRVKNKEWAFYWKDSKKGVRVIAQSKSILDIIYRGVKLLPFVLKNL